MGCLPLLVSATRWCYSRLGGAAHQSRLLALCDARDARTMLQTLGTKGLLQSLLLGLYTHKSRVVADSSKEQSAGGFRKPTATLCTNYHERVLSLSSFHHVPSCWAVGGELTALRSTSTLESGDSSADVSVSRTHGATARKLEASNLLRSRIRVHVLGCVALRCGPVLVFPVPLH